MKSCRYYAFVFSACVAQMLTCSTYAFFAPFFPIHAVEYGLSRQDVGVIFGALSFAQLLISPVAGPLASRFSRRNVLSLGMLINSCCTVVFCFVPHGPGAFPLFIFARAGQGVGAALASTCLYAILVDVSPDARGTLVAAAEFSASLGWTLGPAAGGVMYDLLGFSGPFWLTAALDAIALLFVLCLWPRNQERPVSDALVNSSLCSVLKAPGVLLVGFTQASLIATWSSFDLGFATWLKGVFGFDTLMCGLFFSIGPASSMILMPVVGRLIDKGISKKLMLSFGFLGQAVSFGGLASPFHVGPTGVAFFMLINGLTAPCVIVPALPEMLTFIDGDDEHSVNCMTTFFATVTNFGATIGPLLGARAIGALGFPGLMRAVTVIDLFSIFLLVCGHMFFQRRHHEQESCKHKLLTP